MSEERGARNGGPEESSAFPVPRSVLPLPRGREIRLGGMPLVMGILNVTPDSFSDGGVHFDRPTALHGALQMEEDGAHILDIGGESTRPGSEEVSIDAELDRVIPVIREIRRRSDIPISVDTRKSRVAAEALEAGADLINDVSALRHDPGMRTLAAQRGVPVILMHMRGEPRTMQQHTQYDEVVTDVARELSARRDDAIAAGIDPSRILVDPGIGFAKTFEQNLEILNRCRELAALGPVVIGASRKAFIGHITGHVTATRRAAGSLAAVAAAYRGGAAIVRVHDVRETVDFLKVLHAIERKGASASPTAAGEPAGARG